MSFYNGVPIIVVSAKRSVSMPTDAQPRRPIDENVEPKTVKKLCRKV